MHEAVDENLDHYESLGQLFRRKLKPSERPISDTPLVGFKNVKFKATYV